MRRYIELLRVSSVIDATRLNYLLGAAIFFTYLLMGMGAFVTSTGSGLACPDALTGRYATALLSRL